MSNPNQIPLVLDGDQIEQLQPQDDLDIPLRSYVLDLERRYRLLLADYIQKFGNVPSLGDENARALAQG